MQQDTTSCNLGHYWWGGEIVCNLGNYFSWSHDYIFLAASNKFSDTPLEHFCSRTCANPEEGLDQEWGEWLCVHSKIGIRNCWHFCCLLSTVVGNLSNGPQHSPYFMQGHDSLLSSTECDPANQIITTLVRTLPSVFTFYSCTCHRPDGAGAWVSFRFCRSVIPLCHQLPIQCLVKNHHLSISVQRLHGACPVMTSILGHTSLLVWNRQI